MGLTNDSPDSISIVYRFVLVNSIVRLVKWKADRFCFFNWMWCAHWLHQTSKGCIIHSTWAFTELSFTQTRIIHSTQPFTETSLITLMLCFESMVKWKQTLQVSQNIWLLVMKKQSFYSHRISDQWLWAAGSSLYSFRAVTADHKSFECELILYVHKSKLYFHTVSDAATTQNTFLPVRLMELMGVRGETNWAAEQRVKHQSFYLSVNLNHLLHERVFKSKVFLPWRNANVARRLHR